MNALVPFIKRLYVRRRAGNAAVEFALTVPVLLACTIAVIDLGFAFNCKLRLANAVSAGVQYAFTNGQNVASAGVPTLLTNIQTIVTGSFTGIGSVTVTDLYNNSATSANANSCYCITPGSPAVWTVATCGSTCTTPANVPAGKFVTITGTYNFQPFFSGDRFLTNATTLSDTAIVRVQ